MQKPENGRMEAEVKTMQFSSAAAPREGVSAFGYGSRAQALFDVSKRARLTMMHLDRLARHGNPNRANDQARHQALFVHLESATQGLVRMEELARCLVNQTA